MKKNIVFDTNVLISGYLWSGNPRQAIQLVKSGDFSLLYCTGSIAVDNPILNNLFEEPKEYWIYDEGDSKKMSGRHPDTQIEKLSKPESVYF